MVMKEAAFQQWVYSLSWDELQSAMTVSFPRESSSATSASGNLELDLLDEMIRLQSPPPTPVHAKVVPRVAASDSCTDGRDALEQMERNRFRCPRLFQWVEQTSYSRRKAKSFVVQARRFPQLDNLDLHCAREQQEADEALWQRATFVRAPDEKVTYLKWGKAKESASNALQLMRVASRGHFLCSSFKGRFPSPSCAATFRSPWLDPTKRWFSLSMYLASRFELALFDAFRTKRINRISVWPRSLFSVLSLEEIQHNVSKALVDNLGSEMRNINALLLRDSSLWFLLQLNSYQRGVATLSPTEFLDSLVVSTITQPRIFASLQQNLRRSLYQHFLLATERSLLMDSSSDSTAKKGNISASRRNESSSRSKQRRNKRKKKRNSKAPPLLPKESAMEKQDSSKESISSDEDEPTEPCTQLSISFLDNGTSSRDRNRNVVFALSILDDLLETVFERVGLEPDSDPLAIESEMQKGESSTENEIQKESLLKIGNKSTEKSGDKPVAESSQWKEFDRGDQGHAAVSFELQKPGHDSPSIPQRGALDPFISYGAFPAGIFHRPDPHALGFVDSEVETWWRSRGSSASRDESLLAEFFHSQEGHLPIPTEDQVMASSTAASIASSRNGDQSETQVCDTVDEEVDGIITGDTGDVQHTTPKGITVELPLKEQKPIEEEKPVHVTSTPTSEVEMRKLDERSLSPPSTPSPTLSPILLSLSDLCEMRKDSVEGAAPTDSLKMPSVRSLSSVSALSLPGPADGDTLNTGAASSGGILSGSSLEKTKSPDREEKMHAKTTKKSSPLSSVSVSYRRKPAPSNPSRSRDDQDIKFKATQRRPADVLSSYRNVVVRHTSRDDHDIRHSKSIHYRQITARPPIRSYSSSKTPLSHLHISTPLWKVQDGKDTCVQSELTTDGHDDYQQWSRGHRAKIDSEVDNCTDSQDGSTTITSALSQRESEDTSTLKEERDAYRDMVLTLGAEVAKLKNILAAQKGTMYTPGIEYPSSPAIHHFDPGPMRSVYVNAPRAMTLGAMSDAGLRGDHESQMSEDEAGRPRQFSSGATLGGSQCPSDTSIDHNSGHPAIRPSPLIPLTRPPYEPVSLQGNGLQSRLAKDIMRFLDATNLQLQKQEPRKRSAIERMTRLVNTMWPRAQVKLYGSNVTGLSLPSSDLDFVIYLPAVHQKPVAVAPGVLEGRNAINETSQKLLARTLKGESWIDPRSMKLIERTAVPVIKVSTKDTRARMLQLDITFASPGHHGVAALDLVSNVIVELPMIRPLVIVLKQFLSHRGLLTAYTGGLSSYGLFLMVARYLQEQAHSFCDCGSLLIGFLDFYGNNFDPRSTGISVRNRIYFSRQTTPPLAPTHPAPVPQQPSWRPHSLNTRSTQFFRRNSFNDKGNADSVRGAAPAIVPRPPFQMHMNAHANHQVEPNSSFEQNMPYTLDPLLVEDPLNETNNVGRNAFRIFSVLRAFSDAHRALVASLEWDIQSAVELDEHNEYPLLKCLLQSEDVVFNDL